MMISCHRGDPANTRPQPGDWAVNHRLVNTDGVISLRRANDSDVEGCVSVLSHLPNYFTSNTHDELRASMPRHLAWVAIDDANEARIVGFLLAEKRYARSAEITFAAVRPEHRSAGIGTQLLDRLLDDLGEHGVQLVQAKTLDVTSEYEPYVATRAFWEARGFVQVDSIDPLPGWQPGNPSAIYVAALDSTR